MRGRSFEHGYTIVFGLGGLTKYLLLVVVIVVPYLMVVYVNEPLLTYLK